MLTCLGGRLADLVTSNIAKSPSLDDVSCRSHIANQCGCLNDAWKLTDADN